MISRTQEPVGPPHGRWPLQQQPSIHDVEPFECGGFVARRGFKYQDHVAVVLCLDMLAYGQITQIWCEFLDDLTLLLSLEGGTCVEHVQVKDTQGIVWGVSGLSRRHDGRLGTSVLERSLAHDRCMEPCRFRIITSADVDADLRGLTVPRDHPTGATPSEQLLSLIGHLRVRVPEAVSANGRGVDFWVLETLWEVWGSDSAVSDKGNLGVARLAYELFGISAPDHHKALYDHILGLVFDAAVANPNTERDAKKIRVTELLQDVRQRACDLKRPAPPSGGTRLRHELRAIGVADLEVDSILVQHKRFTFDLRQQRYLSLESYESLFAEVESSLRQLRLERVARDIEASSDLEFHNLCLRRLRELRDRASGLGGVPPIEFFEGIMYEQVNRSLHTFREPSLQGECP